MKVDVFIKQCKSLFDQLGTQLRVVIGNQSADLDSIASAISYAFYLTNRQDNKSFNFVPVINSTKSVLASKNACTHMFQQLSIDLDDLIYLGDLKERERIRDVHLVDHNELDARESTILGGDETVLVCGLIDHHIDKGRFKSASPRLIDTRVGSNASLVVAAISQANMPLDSSFAHMLLYPILNDTSNLTRITHQIDIDAVEYLMRFANNDLDRAQLYAKIDELKFSQDGSEPVGELLRQDYKAFGDAKWGMSSLTFGLAEWLRAGNNLNEIDEFVKTNGLCFYAILSFYRGEQNEYKRDMIVMGDETTLRKFVDVRVANLDQIGQVVVYDKSASYVIFKVTDSSLSRKYWQPVLEKFLQDNHLV